MESQIRKQIGAGCLTNKFNESSHPSGPTEARLRRRIKKISCIVNKCLFNVLINLRAQTLIYEASEAANGLGLGASNYPLEENRYLEELVDGGRGGGAKADDNGRAQAL